MIVDMVTLDRYVDDGWLTCIEHEHLCIYNYSQRCTFDKHWDDITKMCRGLVVDMETGQIEALPWGKFFNHGEEPTEIPARAPDCATIKLDGSLGISYRLHGKTRWTTRGSFYSTQAAVAQKIWDEKYSHIQVPSNLTLLCEIIHPDTKNVISYDFEDLIILGIRDLSDGNDWSYNLVSDWCARNGMRVVEQVPMDFDAAVARAAELDDQHEGFVLRWGDYRVKVKSAQYMKVARLISGLTPRAMADLWYAGIGSNDLPALPEEFRMSLDLHHSKLDLEVLKTATASSDVFNGHKHIDNRKDFVQSVGTKHPYFGLVMTLFSNKEPDYRMYVYRQLHDGKPRELATNEYGGWSFRGIDPQSSHTAS